MNWNFLNPLIWRRSFLLWLLIGFIIIWFAFLDTYSLWTRYQLEREKTTLVEETEEFQKKTEQLEEKIDQMNNDPEKLERIARERYGMRMPDENVYRIRN